MNSDRNFERTAAEWLNAGSDWTPPHVIDAVLLAVRTTPQERDYHVPWRTISMRVSLYVAAVIAVLAVAGAAAFYAFAPGPNIGSIPTPTPTAQPTQEPSPTPAASPTASPTQLSSPSPAANRLPFTSGELAPGTYYIDAYYVTQGARFTFTMPAGWASDENTFLTKDDEQPSEVLLTPWWVTHVFTDACEWEEDSVVEVETVEELVAALANQQGREASPPTETTLGGFPATRIELTVPADFDTSTCSNGNLRYWPGPGPDFDAGLCCNPPGNTDAVYVVDVDGNPLVVVARHYPESPEESRTELQAILDSIQIEPRR